MGGGKPYKTVLHEKCPVGGAVAQKLLVGGQLRFVGALPKTLQKLQNSLQCLRLLAAVSHQAESSVSRSRQALRHDSRVNARRDSLGLAWRLSSGSDDGSSSFLRASMVTGPRKFSETEVQGALSDDLPVPRHLYSCNAEAFVS